MSKLAIDGGAPVFDTTNALKAWPTVGDEEKQAVLAALQNASPWRWPLPPVVEFEAEWASYLGVQYSLACNSGTAALHMAVAASGVQAGDEVIVPADTFLASASCILQANAIPVFADVDPKTGNISPEAVAHLLRERTRAVIAVDLHGLPASYDELKSVLRGKDVVLIEDGSQAEGATYRDRKVGSLGDIGACSLNGSKTLSGLGEGGVFSTDSLYMRNVAAQVMMFGERESLETQYRDYDVDMIGWNYRIHVLAAAFASAQLRKLDEMSRIRSDNGSALVESLQGIDSITTHTVPPDTTHVYFHFPLLLNEEFLQLPTERLSDVRDAACDALVAEGLYATPWQRMPLPKRDLFQKREGYGGGCPWTCRQSQSSIFYKENFPHATSICDRRIVLGQSRSSLGPPNGREEMASVAECLDKVFGRNIGRVIDRAIKR